MADQSKDVELRIRARDYSQKTLGQLTKIIGTLTDVMSEQQAAAELGEGSNKDLAATYQRLEDAGKQLLRLDALTKLFERQSKAVDEAAKATEEAKNKQAALAEELSKVETLTKKQQKAMEVSAKQTERATKAEETRRTTLARTAAEMTKYGVDTTRATEAQGRFSQMVGQVNAALERQSKTMDALPATSRAAKLQQEAAAQRTLAQQVADKEVAAAQKKAAAERAAADQVVQALQRQADQAIATARGYQSLGRVIVKTSDDQSRYASSLQQIISPAAAARSTMSGVEKQVADLSAEIAKGGKNIQDGAAKLKELGAAQASLLNMGKGIDAYRQQVAVVREARATYVAARDEVKALAAQMKAAGADAGALGAKLNAAQQNLKTAANALRATTQSARDSREALRQAGINTAQLSSAQERLTATANRTVTSAQQVSAALRQQREAGKGAASMFESLSDSGRESLSIYQRLRGEVLALATAYAGVQGTINLAGGAVDAYKLRQQAMIKIASYVGESTEAQTAEWEYLIGISNKLGLSISDTAQAYTKFAVSANSVGVSLQETKYVFEAVAKASRAYGLGADDINGVFRALEQMYSKGQVYAEELRQQLGERLPGAVSIFAQGMGVSVAEMNKRLEQGLVATGDEMSNFARRLGELTSAGAEAASAGVQAAEARVQSAMTLFKLAIADSGFIEHYARMLERLSEFLNSAEGQLAAAKLGEAFSHVADAVIYLAENLDTVKEVIIALALLKFGQMLVGMAVNVSGLVTKIKTLTTTIWALDASLLAANTSASLLKAGLLRLIPVVGLILAAWTLGEWAYDTSETFRQVADTVGLYLRGAIELLGTLIATIPEGLKDAARGAKHAFMSMFSEQEEFKSGTAQLWEDLAKSWADAQDKMDKKHAESTKYRMGLVNTEFTGWMNKIDELNRKQLSPSGDQGGFAGLFGDQTQAPPLTRPGFQFTEDPGGGSTAASREVARLTKQYEKLGLAADKAAKAAREALVRKDLPGRLQLIDEEFAPRYAEASKVQGEAGKQLAAQLDAIVAKRKEVERLEFENATKGAANDTKRASALQALRNQYEQLEAAFGQREAKVDTTKSFAERMAADLAKVSVQYDQLIAKAKKLGDQKLAGQFEDLKKQNLELATLKARTDELKRLEGEANAQLEIKRSRLQEINALREAGVISEDEQVARTVALYNQQNEAIAASVNNLEAFARTMQSSMTAEQFAKINAEIATMRAGLQDISGTYDQWDTTVVQGVLDGMSTSLQTIASDLVEVFHGSMSIGDAFKNLGQVVQQFFADFLLQIAQAILQQMLLNALAGAGWGGVSSAATSMGGTSTTAAVRHSGGIVGARSNRTRDVSASWFANAPRYHDGGLPGLKRDEMPTILQKGEQVLSKDDPNNIMNGGPQTSAPAQPLGVKIVNTFDAADVVSQGLSTAAGEQSVLNVVRTNRSAIKNLLK